MAEKKKRKKGLSIREKANFSENLNADKVMKKSESMEDPGRNKRILDDFKKKTGLGQGKERSAGGSGPITSFTPEELAIAKAAQAKKRKK